VKFVVKQDEPEKSRITLEVSPMRPLAASVRNRLRVTYENLGSCTRSPI
jgi:hypothetical protein